MTTRSTSEKQKTEAATTSSGQTESQAKLEFSGFWFWESEMERLGQWPGLSELLKERTLEGGNNNHGRTTHTYRIHTPSVLRR